MLSYTALTEDYGRMHHQERVRQADEWRLARLVRRASRAEATDRRRETQGRTWCSSTVIARDITVATPEGART